ncbi:MAG: septum formation initiator family protein [Erysipelotrichaceae bacterium]
MAKEKRKLKKTVTKLIALCFFAGSGWLIYQVYLEVMTTIALKEEKVLVEEELAIIEKENESLISQKTKLEDEDYVQSYARGNYLFSKEGEQIYYLPGSKEE